MISIDKENFGTLCICAIRYCHGRQTYMPSLVQGIVRSHIKELSDETLDVMLQDCDFQRRFGLYGDEVIDKPDWLKWEQTVKEEVRRREDGKA